MDLNEWLHRCPIIAILRGVHSQEVTSICSALEGGGIAIVEVPLNSPGPLRSIEVLANEFGDRLLIGAGTVTDPKAVADIAAAGGRLVVTPHADRDIVYAAKAAGLLAVPGFFNPTEAFALLHAGADALKLFPSEVLGIPMMKAVRAVLPKSAGIIPVGGIDADNIARWMAAGAAGVGVGSAIYKPGDDAAIVQQKTNMLMTAMRSGSSSEAAQQ
ncbi:MAG: 2-dehydro-3-deoxy-6-phosphogalactonate aldolase [Acidobacteriaceae bacterium]